MAKGLAPKAYFNQPSSDKSLPEIWQDLHNYTGELWANDDIIVQSGIKSADALANDIDWFVVLPPAIYDGIFMKGIAITQAADWVIERYPFVQELYHVVASSCFAGYPWSTKADGYLTGYDYPAMLAWFREHHPERARNKTFIPLEKADFTHEYRMAPVSRLPKTTEVITVSSFEQFKNPDLLAQALKMGRQKYPQSPYKLVWIVGYDFDLNLNGLSEGARHSWKQMELILEHISEYIYFIPKASPYEVSQYLSQSKVAVLSSFIEGKNRFLHEAISCNIPAVHFNNLCQYIRPDGMPYLPPNSGWTCDPNPEAMADALHFARHHSGDMTPRQSFLEHGGRRHFLNVCMSAFPYYAQTLPGWQEQASPFENEWLQLAVQWTTGSSLWDHLYDARPELSMVRGLQAIEQLLTPQRSLLTAATAVY